MNIEPIANGNLRIWLTEDEMEQWGLQEGQGEGVRRLVRRALSAGGYRPGMRVCAELFPVEGGGVLLVSPMVHTRRMPMAFAITENALLEVYNRRQPLWGETEAPVLQVYAMGEEYRILVYSSQPLCEGRLALLTEYGQPLGNGDGIAAHIAEYGRWIGQITAPAPAPPEPAALPQ